MESDSPSSSGGAPEALPVASTSPPAAEPASATGVTVAVAPPQPSPSPPGTSDQVSLSPTTAAATASTRAEPSASAPPPSRYESQKRRDWNTFLQYLKNHKPPLALGRCSGAHVIEFLKYLDQFGKTKVHISGCDFFGHPSPPAPCACPLRQAWGSLDALIGRLRAAFEENGGRPESNPFGARAVRIYLREVRESQAKARGIPYEKKKRKRQPPPPTAPAAGTAQGSSSSATVAETSSSGGGGQVGGQSSSSPAGAGSATAAASSSA